MGIEGFIASIEAIREALGTNVFEQPGTVTKLPKSLGGDQTRWPKLEAAAKRKDGFFELLWSKAHFLMLPKPIVAFMNHSNRLSITEALPEVAGATEDKWYTIPTPSTDPTAVTMYIPGASNFLARVGCCLGRVCETADPYEDLSTIYHEMTHAWLFLQKFADAGIQELYNEGAHAYQGSTGIDGTVFTDPNAAFSEAAGAYVEERISRWCTALWSLSEVLEKPVQRWKLTEPPTIADEYDAPLRMPGKVRVPGRPRSVMIQSPMLSAALRDAIDAKILDGRPLTATKFSESPQLVGLRDAALGH